MTLHICLSQHIHTILVTQVIEDGIVGIVRGTDGINVQTLHRLDILFNLLCRDGTTIHRREVVTVHTMKDHTLTVDEKSTIIADAHLTEAHFATTNINRFPLRILQGQHQVIKVRSLCTPQFGSCHIHIEAQLFVCLDRLGCLRNRLSTFLNLHFHLSILHCIKARQIHLHIGLCIHETGIEVSREEVVTNLALGSSPQEAMTLNTCQSPIVLTLQERTTGEAINLQGDGILTLGQIICDIEFRRQIGVFAIAHTLTIHPEVITVTHTVETHIDISAFPTGRHCKLTAIGTHRIGHIPFVGEPSWTVSHHAVGVLVEGERISHITIEGLVPILVVMKAINLPAGGYINIAPSSIIIVFLAHLRIHFTGV